MHKFLDLSSESINVFSKFLDHSAVSSFRKCSQRQQTLCYAIYLPGIALFFGIRARVETELDE